MGAGQGPAPALGRPGAPHLPGEAGDPDVKIMHRAVDCVGFCDGVRGPSTSSSSTRTSPFTHYWDYSGSFTTPLCTEVVVFFVMMDTVTLSQAQLDASAQRSVGDRLRSC